VAWSLIKISQKEGIMKFFPIQINLDTTSVKGNLKGNSCLKNNKHFFNILFNNNLSASCDKNSELTSIKKESKQNFSPYLIFLGLLFLKKIDPQMSNNINLQNIDKKMNILKGNRNFNEKNLNIILNKLQQIIQKDPEIGELLKELHNLFQKQNIFDINRLFEKLKAEISTFANEKNKNSAIDENLFKNLNLKNLDLNFCLLNPN